MVVLRALALLTVAACLAASLALSGCASGPGSANLAGIPSGSPASGPNAGTASDHAQPTRTEGAVSVDQEGGQYVARKTVTITDDFGGASTAAVSVKTGAGGVTTRAWSDGGYKVVAILQARAGTESQARSALADIHLTHSDHLAGNRLTLATEATMPSSSSGISRSATITDSLPSEPAYDVYLRAGSGGAESSGLGGPTMDASTGSGGVSVHGAFGRLTAEAGSGGVDVGGTANDVSLSTGSGGVEADLKPGGSGTWTFHTGSGGVVVKLGHPKDSAYDVDAQAGSGGVSVSLMSGQPVGTQTRTHQHLRCSDFDSAPIKVTVNADAGSGGVEVDG